jgi:hypothetical protein
MKKLLMLLLVFALLSILLVAAIPASAAGFGTDAANGPPGWSHENPGSGGSDSPGPGGKGIP